MISPTGMGIRDDAGGSGHYGARRGNRRHKGTDFKSKAGQNVVAPHDMEIVRLSLPMSKTYLSGIAFKTHASTGRIFYFDPDMALIGEKVKEGDVIGIAQDLQPHYTDDVGNHIHYQINSFDPMVFVCIENNITGDWSLWK